MSELLFPAAALGLIFLVVMPALTALSWGALAWRRRLSRSYASFGDRTTFALLVAPTLVPVAWLTSSALHQSEPASDPVGCLVDHVAATTCLDAALLLGLTVLGVAAMVGVRLWRERLRWDLERLSGDDRRVALVASVVAGDAHLRGLDVQVVRDAPEPVFTAGWVRPRVVLDARFVEGADEGLLRAALLHEHAHVIGHDTMRGFLARLCLEANPAGALLAPDLARWHAAREAQCDGEAVHRGGQPLALAEGIVRAARMSRARLGRCGVASLCGHGALSLKLRLALLMEGPRRPTRALGQLTLAATLLLVLVAPHVDGLGALEHFHFEVERALHALAGG